MGSKISDELPPEKAILEGLQQEYNSLLNVYEETQQRLRDADTGKQDVQMQGEKPPQVMQTGSTVQSGEEKPFEKGPAPGPGNELDNYARSFFKKISKI